MTELSFYLVRECFAPSFCIIIVGLFLIADRKNYDKVVIRLFEVLIALVAVESVCGGFEKFLCAQSYYVPVRVFLSWVCYITGPGIILTVIELMIRKAKPVYKWLMTVPEIINILITSLAFFTNLVFYYDKSNQYHTGPLAIVPRGMVVVYLVLVIVAAFFNIRRSHRECTIALICVGFLMLSTFNEFWGLVDLDLRSTSLSLGVVAYFLCFTALNHKSEVKALNNNFSETEQQLTRQMIDQTIETLAFTIDAKDNYTRGHSFRVAKYARQIARLDGKSEEECRSIYITGLLHDIGKISISDSIINKPGRLTEDEFSQIKKHPANGAKILGKMKNFPMLLEGAKYHHERYDGKGYPEGIKGTDIPEMARIIAVADAYDAMTSHRSYRKTMNQADVKQEIWKGMGSQFDPHFAKIMIALIDSDAEFDMREKPDENDDILQADYDKEIVWGLNSPESQEGDYQIPDNVDTSSYGAFISTIGNWAKIDMPLHVTEIETTAKLTSRIITDSPYIWNVPTAILFTSDDGKFLGKNFSELNVMVSSGYNWTMGATKKTLTTFDKLAAFDNWDNWIKRNVEGLEYTVSMKRDKNLVYVKIDNEYTSFAAMICLPENYEREVYLAITGEWCDIYMGTLLK